jgi:hypothetical protein
LLIFTSECSNSPGGMLETLNGAGLSTCSIVLFTHFY